MFNSCLFSYLNNVKYKDTKTFVPPIRSGKVIKVYDGDTITIASKMPYFRSPIYRFSVRLNGIDTPEIKSKDPFEKEIAFKARDYLSEKILDQKVTLKNVQTEKYGRLLADVYHQSCNINNDLIEKRYAVTYDGGTKQSPDNWRTYHYSDNQI